MSHPVYTLLIGSRNFSSWSLRAWLALKRCGTPFDCELFDLRGPQRALIKGASPSAQVPLLRVPRPGAEDFAIWDTLAIAEFLAERRPDALLWPHDPFARARARSICAEMHSGFADIRRSCPMNMIARVADHQITGDTRAQIQRIAEIWTNCRKDYGLDGDFLFGCFGIADCFYAPVVSRFQTYDIALQGHAKAYAEAILNWPDMKEWIAAAAQEEARRA